MHPWLPHSPAADDTSSTASTPETIETIHTSDDSDDESEHAPTMSQSPRFSHPPRKPPFPSETLRSGSSTPAGTPVSDKLLDCLRRKFHLPNFKMLQRPAIGATLAGRDVDRKSVV